MVTNVESMATALKQEALAGAVGTKLMKMAKDVAELEEAELLKLLESTKVLEMAVEPHLGAHVDLRC